MIFKIPYLRANQSNNLIKRKGKAMKNPLKHIIKLSLIVLFAGLGIHCLAISESQSQSLAEFSVILPTGSATQARHCYHTSYSTMAFIKEGVRQDGKNKVVIGNPSRVPRDAQIYQNETGEAKLLRNATLYLMSMKDTPRECWTEYDGVQDIVQEGEMVGIGLSEYLILN